MGGLCCLAPLSVAWAEDEVMGRTSSALAADHLVSVSSGYSQSEQSAPAVTTIITAEQIKAIGAQDLYDILRTVPGFFFGQNTIQIEPIISVRGFKSSFNQNVLILLDGIPQTERVTGDRLAVLGKIPLDLIERIEIMRGPGSALYGADAYSAVIDIMTRKTAPDRSQVTVSAGSHQTRTARWLSGGQWGDFAVVGAVEYHETDGDHPFISADSQTTLDSLLHTHASLAPGHANTHLKLLGAQINLTSPNLEWMTRVSLGRDLGMGIGLANALDPFGEADLTTLEARGTWKTAGKNWQTKVVLDELFYRSAINNAHYFPAGAFGLFSKGVISSTDMLQNTTRLQGSWEYTGLAAHHLSVGVGLETGRTHQNSESRNYVLVSGWPVSLGSVQTLSDPHLWTFGAKDFFHDTQFVYLQDEWQFLQDWRLAAGVRYDHYSDYGDQLSPRLALVWDTTPYLTTKLIYGRGFRGPSLLDTHARQSIALSGNPNLKPETVNSLELAFDYRPYPALRTRLNLFHQKTNDQIQIFTATDGTSIPRNTGQQIGRGAELEAWWEINRQTQLYAAYSYQDSVDKTTDTDVGYHPHHLFYARLQHQRKPWLFSLQARYVGDRARRDGDTRSEAETYFFVDGLAHYDITPDWEAEVTLRNLLNRRAADAGPGLMTAFPSDIPLSGRTFYFTLTRHF